MRFGSSAYLRGFKRMSGHIPQFRRTPMLPKVRVLRRIRRNIRMAARLIEIKKRFDAGQTTDADRKWLLRAVRVRV